MIRKRSTSTSITLTDNLSVGGNTTLGNASGDTLTITGTAVSVPNGLNVDSNTLVVDAANNRVGIATASPTVPLDVTGAAAFSGAVAASGGLTVTGGVSLVGASGSTVFSLATAGARVKFGNTNRYISDNGSKTNFTGGVQSDDSFEAPGIYGTNAINTPLAIAYGQVPLAVKGGAADGASAIGVKIASQNTYTTSGALIAAFYAESAMSTIRASVDKDGLGTFNGGVAANNVTGCALTVTGDTTSPATAAMRLVPQDAEPTGAHLVGHMYVTSAGVLKICTAAGTPGTWVSVGAQ